MASADHPVIHALRETTKLRPADLDFLIEHGRDFQGAPLPDGVERFPIGSCYAGAQELEDRGFGRFVRGFVIRPGDRRPLAHGWVTPDDERALDARLSRPAFVRATLAKALREAGALASAIREATP